MGFSVSGAAAIIFASMFIAFGMWYTAVDNSFDQVSSAQGEQIGDTIDTSNTDINISEATHDGGVTEGLTVMADNTGTTELSLNGTHLLVDGELLEDWQADAEVNGDDETDLWLPGEELEIQVDPGPPPDRVKLITEHGIADHESVQVN